MEYKEICLTDLFSVLPLYASILYLGMPPPSFVRPVFHSVHHRTRAWTQMQLLRNENMVVRSDCEKVAKQVACEQCPKASGVRKGNI